MTDGLLLGMNFMPHGHCYFWQPEILWPNVIGDALTVLAYYLIPILLIYFIRKRKDLEFKGIFFAFAGFILACGTVHLITIISVWEPMYRLEATVKIITAIFSIVTVYILIRNMPVMLTIPGPKQIQEQNELLLREVEERKNAQNDLLRRTFQLEDVNDQLKRFAYATSHDLKEPSRNIATLLQGMKKRSSGQLDAESTKDLDFVIEEGVRMQKMVENLVNYAEVGNEEIELTDVDMNLVVELAKEGLAEEISSTGAIIDYKDLPYVKGNLSKLVQLMQNLLSNSLKFKGDKPPYVTVTAEPTNGNKVIIKIKDNGIGFDEQYATKIFEVFERLNQRQQYNGLGMGLAMSKRIIESLGGAIGARSVIGEGSTFYFILPKAA